MGMMMDSKQIQKRLEALSAAMRLKGVVRPNVYLMMNAMSEPSVMLYARPNGGYIDDTIESFHNKGVATLLDEAEKYIAKMPSKERRQFDDFMRSLGECIEKGKKLDIEVDINPLMALVESLSKNAVEYRPLAGS